MVDYTTVTEISGDKVSKEQVQRMCNRYFWAGEHIRDKEVLEVACGAGHGLKYFATTARRVVAGDITDTLVTKAKANAGPTVEIHRLNADSLPFADQSFDTIILFEAIYYLENPSYFLKECQRVLKPQGKLLIATANKDLFDFNPSPYSHQYYGVPELNTLLAQYGFKSRFFGDTPLQSVPLKQKILRPIKKLAVKLNLIPKSMKGKQFLKKLVFGEMMEMPHFISSETMSYIKPTEIPNFLQDKKHKVIFCEATLTKE